MRRLSLVTLVILAVAETATAVPTLSFTNDLLGDYAGPRTYEVHGIGSGIEDGRLFFEVRTNLPQSGGTGRDSYAYTTISPGDVLIAVGAASPFDLGAMIHGIAATSHGNVAQQAYGGEVWQNVAQGLLYKDATFADGTYEEYQDWLGDRGQPFAPYDGDGNDRVNSYPTFIKNGTEVAGASGLEYSRVHGEDWDYAITGWVDLDEIGLLAGMDYALFFAPECGNDGAVHTNVVPAPVVPEPAAGLILLLGLPCLRRLRE